LPFTTTAGVDVKSAVVASGEWAECFSTFTRPGNKAEAFLAASSVLLQETQGGSLPKILTSIKTFRLSCRWIVKA